MFAGMFSGSLVGMSLEGKDKCSWNVNSSQSIYQGVGKENYENAPDTKDIPTKQDEQVPYLSSRRWKFDQAAR